MRRSRRPKTKREEQANSSSLQAYLGTPWLMASSDTLRTLCKVFSGDDSEDADRSTPDLSWDESSSSEQTWLRPCLRVLTQQESMGSSFYAKEESDTMSYRVDFSMQTVYYHDLTVQVLRDQNDCKETSLNAHSISMQPDPWQVSVSSVPTETVPRTKEERSDTISRWSRPTRERLWAEFCMESKKEKEQKSMKEFQFAEKDLDDVTNVDDNFEQFEVQTRELEKTLDAMESIW